MGEQYQQEHLVSARIFPPMDQSEFEALVAVALDIEQMLAAEAWERKQMLAERKRRMIAQAIIDALKATTAGLFPGELAQMLDKPAGIVRKELWRLHKEGLIARRGNNKYTWPGSPDGEEEI